MNDMTKFNYSLLPTDFQQEDIEFLEHCATDIEVGGRIAIEGIMRIGKRLNDARSKFGENDKAFGQWRKGRLPWLEYQTALNFMRVHSKFGDENLLYKNYRVEKLAPSILYALSAPSTPESVIDRAIEQAESGDKVTVADVKQWKEAAQVASQRAEEFRKESNERRKKIRELEQQVDLLKAEKPEPEVRIEAPDDYEQLKKTERDLRSDLAELKKQQRELVQQQVTAKLKERESELAEIDQKIKGSEEILAGLQKHIDRYSYQQRELKVHLNAIEEARKALVLLAANLEGFESVIDSDHELRLWRALSQMMRNGADAIDFFVGDSKPALTVIK